MTHARTHAHTHTHTHTRTHTHTQQLVVAVLILLGFALDLAEAQILPGENTHLAALFGWMDLGLTTFFAAELCAAERIER